MLDSEIPDFRHFDAFRFIYQERCFTAAGHAMGSSRKAVRHLIEALERSLGGSMFHANGSKDLEPTPFGERLHNDLRYLADGRQRLHHFIESTRASGRVLHIGSSPAAFRTRAHRRALWNMRQQASTRIAFSMIAPDEAGKALLSGACDFYIGCWRGDPRRFESRPLGEVAYRCYACVDQPRNGAGELSATGHWVRLDSCDEPPPPIPGRVEEWRALDEAEWLHWLEYPEDAAPGALVCGPELATGESRWTPVALVPLPSAGNTLHGTYLRQHPYEFLPGLAEAISRSSSERS